MNKTQKWAWCVVLLTLLYLALNIYIGVEFFVLRSQPKGAYWPGLAFYLLIGISIIFVRKKQSPAEPDSDERDELIKKRAVRISFISAWLLLASANIITALILGQDGSIPVYLLSLINAHVFLMTLLIYSVAILVQYGWRNKGEKSMNRTQKEALFCLVSGLLTLPMFAYGFYKLFILKETATDLERFLLLAVVILVLGTLLALLVWTLKRQSPREIEADERDKQITNKAAMVSLISACILLPIVSVIPRLILGDRWMRPCLVASVYYLWRSC